MLDKKARLTAIDSQGVRPGNCLLLATKAHGYSLPIKSGVSQKSSGSMEPGNHLVEWIQIISG